jgi:subtilisin family serine protease
MTRICIIVLIEILFQSYLNAQFQETATDTYVLYLKDKNHNKYNILNPDLFLSQRALDRRNKQNISIDSTDLPVSEYYIDSLKKAGVDVYNTSRWFNSVTFKTSNASLLSNLQNISFVQSLKKSAKLKVSINEDDDEETSLAAYDSIFYGKSYRQIHVHNGDYMHNKGFRGEGMLIAIIDAGFYGYKTMTSLNKIIAENRIIAIHDFVAHDNDVNLDSNHGSQVFSIIGGELDNSFVGTAPASDFLLLRSEDATYNNNGVQNENLVEEDNWVSAAEYADSLGADLISTSLGYSTFNNSSQDHTMFDLDGETTRISIAADIATKKGMIVITSAGNEGSNSWRFITVPADAKNVLAVGAVNTALVRAPFSSIGPTADNRIKPDVVAIGSGTYLQTPNNEITSGSGTSYAAPVIAGLTACLWQSSPDKTNLEILDAIKRSCNNYDNPDNLTGYGIPNFKKAYFLLNAAEILQGKLIASPNPFSTSLIIQHDALDSNSILIEIFNTSGKKVYNQSFSIEPNVIGEIEINNSSLIPRGMVIIRGKTGNKTLITKALKL